MFAILCLKTRVARRGFPQVKTVLETLRTFHPYIVLDFCHHLFQKNYEQLVKLKRKLRANEYV